MKGLLLMIAVLIAAFYMYGGATAQSVPPNMTLVSRAPSYRPHGVWRFEDPTKDVTCWVYSRYGEGGISCLRNEG